MIPRLSEVKGSVVAVASESPVDESAVENSGFNKRCWNAAEDCFWLAACCLDFVVEAFSAAFVFDDDEDFEPDLDFFSTFGSETFAVVAAVVIVFFFSFFSSFLVFAGFSLGSAP